MHLEWKIATDNPQMMRKLTEFANMCCTRNTSPKLALWTSVTAVTLLNTSNGSFLWHDGINDQAVILMIKQCGLTRGFDSTCV